MAVTGSDIAAAPRLAKARTMSRSLTIPPTEVPSLDTTTAPIPCSASTSSRRRTFVSGGTVTTCVPLPRSTSVIRIWPPGAVTGPDGVPARAAGYYCGGDDQAYPAAGNSRDRKSTRLNSSHGYISYAVFCLQNKTAFAHRAVGKELPSKVLPAGRRTRLTPLPVL